MMRCAEHIEHIGNVKNAYNIFIGIPEGNRPLERPR
jgi:hypothetical protein